MPFQVELADGKGMLYAEKVVRIVPGRRMVVFGTWQGQDVVAKIFLDKKQAKRHLAKEKAGMLTLQEKKVPVPALYYAGSSADQDLQIIISERIKAARNIEDIWQEKNKIADILPELKMLVVELATQHVLGILQHDLHLNNYLFTDKIVYTLDGGQIELFPQILDKKTSMNNIALFLSQLGIGVEKIQIDLYRHYAKSRGWLVKSKEFSELSRLIKKWNNERWHKYERKIFRDSSHFSTIRRSGLKGMYDRRFAGPDLSCFFDYPEHVFQSSNVTMLKSGRSSTVIKVTLDGREYVIKRYNIKGAFHYLRRCLRVTRAAKSWRLAQKLILFRLPTAKPVAYLEKTFLGLRGTSYYVTEYVPRIATNEFFADNVCQISDLFRSLAKLGITHGDLKKSNILIDNNHLPVLIDLDGAKEHESLRGLRSAWRREIERFLRNFDDEPQLQRKFQDELL
jgi:tRNA A-37 threonylcarbamoyl transferase component Bud32